MLTPLSSEFPVGTAAMRQGGARLAPQRAADKAPSFRTSLLLSAGDTQHAHCVCVGEIASHSGEFLTAKSSLGTDQCGLCILEVLSRAIRAWSIPIAMVPL